MSHFVSIVASVLLAGATTKSDSPAEWSADSSRVLSFEEFYRAVASQHPVVRQARLLESIADGNVRQAQGAFDPTLTASWERKSFAGTEYFDYQEAAIKLPTPLGIDLKLGYERTQGRYFAPDRRTPSDGLITAGISIPVGQRMLTDERRTALAQARALRDYAEGDRRAIVNKLLQLAAKRYAEWYEAHRRRTLTRESLTLATVRLEGIRRRVQGGDAAAIDTIEARLEVQRRTVLAVEANVDFANATLLIEGFLWGERATPMRLDSLAVPSSVGLEPSSVDSARLDRWLALAEERHPDIRKSAAKFAQVESERRLVAQQLWVPSAELTYTPIADRAGGLDALGESFGGSDDAKWGASFKLPLLALKERGKYVAAAGKRDQERLQLANVRRDVGIAVRSAANDLAALDTLLQLQAAAVTQARMLRDAEQRMFDAGESTLFLVNARDRQLLDEQGKRIALEAKYAAARAALAVAIGEPAVLPNTD